ncbi:MAG: hypothetical protein FWK04_09430 [Nostoc sp. GBBB01]|nr:hypothetical protein [Nostoc sp. GBBB01]
MKSQLLGTYAGRLLVEVGNRVWGMGYGAWGIGHGEMRQTRGTREMGQGRIINPQSTVNCQHPQCPT